MLVEGSGDEPVVTGDGAGAAAANCAGTTDAVPSGTEPLAVNWDASGTPVGTMDV